MDGYSWIASIDLYEVDDYTSVGDLMMTIHQKIFASPYYKRGHGLHNAFVCFDRGYEPGDETMEIYIKEDNS